MFTRRKVKRELVGRLKDKGYQVVIVSHIFKTLDVIAYNTYRGLYLKVKIGRLKKRDIQYYLKMRAKGEYFSYIRCLDDIEKVIRHNVIPLRDDHERQIKRFIEKVDLSVRYMKSGVNNR